MKRYILAVMISLLLNLSLIGLISIRWGRENRQTPSVELVFDDSTGSLFHDEIWDGGLLSGTEESSDKGRNGEKSGAGNTASSGKSPTVQRHFESFSQEPTPRSSNNLDELNKAEPPSVDSERKNESTDVKLKGGVPPVRTGQAVSDGDNDSASTQSGKKGGQASSVGSGGSNSGFVGTGDGKRDGGSGGGKGEGSGNSGTIAGGSGHGNGLGGGEGSEESDGGAGKAKLNPPVPIKAVEPEYPREARSKGWEGRTYLKLSVNIKGRVMDVQLLESSGYEILDKAAIKAAWRLRYKPATRNGIVIQWYIKKAFLFKLQ